MLGVMLRRLHRRARFGALPKTSFGRFGYAVERHPDERIFDDHREMYLEVESSGSELLVLSDHLDRGGIEAM